MSRLDFNRAIAKRVMGWTTELDSSSYNSTGYTYSEAGDVILGRDFTRDHNAAALVRERVRGLGEYRPFLNHLADYVGTYWPGDVEFSETDVWAYLRATPEQTARAAYAAVTGEELEAIDG